MEDISTQFRRVSVPIAVDLPTGSGELVAIFTAPFRYRTMAGAQLLIGAYVRGRYCLARRRLGVHDLAGSFKPLLSLNAAFNIDAAIFARMIDHHIVAALAHVAGFNRVIHFVERMPELARPS